ncbi:DUF6153 family protein [Nonomuraea sp. NPDC046802]|uniref:DUF6153 family protein n=1 Tax=Nonomuraea sp. NPDC046802 TaxID=3154919 RepID=UPI0033E24E9B
MRGGRVVERWCRVSRWALLVLLVVGVCGMHTLGHLGSHGGAGEHGGSAAMSMPEAGMSETRTPDARMSGPQASEAGMFAGQRVVGGAQRELPDLDPTAVCLAMLTSLLVLFLVALLARAWRDAEPPIGAGLHPGRVPRPPPRLFSLRLARVSVLRI